MNKYVQLLPLPWRSWRSMGRCKKTHLIIIPIKNPKTFKNPPLNQNHEEEAAQSITNLKWWQTRRITIKTLMRKMMSCNLGNSKATIKQRKFSNNNLNVTSLNNNKSVKIDPTILSSPSHPTNLLKKSLALKIHWCLQANSSQWFPEIQLHQWSQWNPNLSREVVRCSSLEYKDFFTEIKGLKDDLTFISLPLTI